MFVYYTDCENVHKRTQMYRRAAACTGESGGEPSKRGEAKVRPCSLGSSSTSSANCQSRARAKKSKAKQSKAKVVSKGIKRASALGCRVVGSAAKERVRVGECVCAREAAAVRQVRAPSTNGERASACCSYAERGSHPAAPVRSKVPRGLLSP